MDSSLGSRPLDKTFDFFKNQQNYNLPAHYLKTFIVSQKNNSLERSEYKSIAQQIFFSREQLKILERIKSFCGKSKEERRANPFRMLIASRAG